MDVLSHPFRLGANGRAVTVPQDSEDALAEAVAVTALTIKGERALVPDFGVTDPVFDELDVAELNAVLAAFGPDVTANLDSVTPTSDTTVLVTLSLDDLDSD